MEAVELEPASRDLAVLRSPPLSTSGHPVLHLRTRMVAGGCDGRGMRRSPTIVALASLGLVACGDDTAEVTPASCFELAGGSCVEETFQNPAVLEPDAQGVYQLELGPEELELNGQRNCGRGYNGQYPGPTIDTRGQGQGRAVHRDLADGRAPRHRHHAGPSDPLESALPDQLLPRHELPAKHRGARGCVPREGDSGRTLARGRRSEGGARPGWIAGSAASRRRSRRGTRAIASVAPGPRCSPRRRTPAGSRRTARGSRWRGASRREGGAAAAGSGATGSSSSRPRRPRRLRSSGWSTLERVDDGSRRRNPLRLPDHATAGTNEVFERWAQRRRDEHQLHPEGARHDHQRRDPWIDAACFDALNGHARQAGPGRQLLLLEPRRPSSVPQRLCDHAQNATLFAEKE